MKKVHLGLLVMVIVFSFSLKLIFANLVPYYSFDDAYYYNSQISHIENNGVIENVRNNLFSAPIIYFIFLLTKLFKINFIYKVIFAIFSTISIYLVYLISLKMTKNENASIFSAFIATFIPISYFFFTNSASPYALALPLTLLNIYLFMSLPQKNTWKYFMASMLLYALVHPSVIILVISFFIYFLVSKLELSKVLKKEYEILFFVSFLIIWVYTLFSKNIFLLRGYSLIWQNIPLEILSSFFTDTSVPEIVYKLGVLPFIVGFYFLYHYIINEKNRTAMILLSYSITVLVLLWFKLIFLNVGILFLGFIFSIFCSDFYNRYFIYMKKTKFNILTTPIFILIMIFFIFSSVFPSISFSYLAIKNSPSPEYVDALNWINENTPEGSTFLANYDEGFMFENIAKREVILNSKFMLEDDINSKFQDVRTVYTGNNKINAVKILNSNFVDYIVLSDKVKSYYNINDLTYIEDDNNCFTLVYDDEIKIYRLDCYVRSK